MIDAGITNITPEPIEAILEDKRTYYVPYFQREYSWKLDDWRALLEDVEQIRTTGEPHFFGFMTFRPDGESKVQIIEGQQRLSTITILLAVIRDILNSIGDPDWGELDRYINKRPGFKTGEPAQPKLRLSALNTDFFARFVQTVAAPEEKIKANRKQKLSLSDQLLLGAYKYYYETLKAQLDTLTGHVRNEYLSSLIKSCTEKLIVITMNVTDELAAYNVFQTINGRGLDLTLTDLLKIHLFEKSGKSNTERAVELWEDMRETLSGINTNSFLRHLWLSTRGLIQEQKLLGEVKGSIKTSAQALTFLEELKVEAEVYEALLNPTSEYWADDQIPVLLGELQILSTQQPLPLLLAGARKFQSSEFKKLLRICIAFVFRYQTIGELENKEMERAFSNIALEIRKGSLENTKGIAQRLAPLYPADSVFLANLKEKTVKSRQVAKYILRSIENSLSGEQEKTATTMTLEHILPISPDEEWKKYLAQNKLQRDELVYRLGNYTLLTRKVNKSAQNRFFEHKRDEWYKQSDLAINSDLKKMKSWTDSDISNRQNWLAEKAIKLWKI